MKNEYDELLDKQNWPRIIKEITLYAYSRLVFWKLISEKGVGGFTAKDVALEAIKKVYSGESKWDPKKGKFIPFLKYYVIDGIISNIATKKETRVTDLSDIQELNTASNVDLVDNLNVSQILSIVRAELAEDEIVLNIFNQLYNGLKRSEICDLIGIDTSEYENAVKRLKAKILRLEKTKIFESIKTK